MAIQLYPQQQRLCIARTIAVRPQIILVDEPASALDPIATLRIEDLKRELAQDYTIIVVAHNMQQAARVSDYTAFFMMDDDRAGYLVETGPTNDLFTNPRDQRTEDYIYWPVWMIGKREVVALETGRHGVVVRRQVLILCTGNSCRSQMAEGLVNYYLGDRWQAHSAGTDPAQASGSDADRLAVFRRVRDEIRHELLMVAKTKPRIASQAIFPSRSAYDLRRTAERVAGIC